MAEWGERGVEGRVVDSGATTLDRPPPVQAQVLAMGREPETPVVEEQSKLEWWSGGSSDE